MTIAWWQLDLQVPVDAAAPVEALLLEAGAEAITFLEQDTSEALFVPGELWQHSHCQALFAADVHAEADLRALIESAAWQHYGASLQAVVDQDWVSSTQAQFPARQFGKLWVVPSWDRAPEDALYQLHLDPGQAFGTGAHPTTSRCLHFLESHIRGGECVIDYGCGSGILAIAALLLGAKTAYGIDTDPQALKVATANAKNNGVAQHLHLSLPEQKMLPQADILVANILAGPLLQLAATLAALTRPDGWIALSGILHSQEACILEAYAPYFNFAMPQHEEDWSLLYGQRKTGD
ncbi:ribosomal protein L11 methyltransferase [Acidithiobacillus marinus]|uniref:Ribosomal protein L11 methyltransferase n=1 Tax=Acidithiobacillus marinus TaxID=187490 RepID=A0A2I1DPV9_9PROT|nr:50S ribosomal protein L11 methyltransferase [Acidithiobacillus marinus]PKY11913.1 ribosomal protein L11 methyltransferase [Acidithiobacillus marinus]